MKKIIIAIVVVAMAVAVGAYFLLGGKSEAALAREAFMGNGAVTCTFIDTETDQEAMLYVRDGDIRISGTGFDPESDEEVASHMIQKDEVMYLWADNEQQGVTLSVDERQTGDEPSLIDDYKDPATFEEAYEQEQVSCSSGADASHFELPGDVEFVDFNELFNMEGVPEGDPEIELDTEEGPVL